MHFDFEGKLGPGLLGNNPRSPRNTRSVHSQSNRTSFNSPSNHNRPKGRVELVQSSW